MRPRDALVPWRRRVGPEYADVLSKRRMPARNDVESGGGNVRFLDTRAAATDGDAGRRRHHL